MPDFQRNPVPPRTSSMMPWLFGLIFGGVGGAIMVACIIWAIYQQRVYDTYRPVPAVVLSSRVETDNSSSNGDTYAPRIRYAYTVEGKRYVSMRDTLLSSSQSGDWAARVVRRYPVGRHCLAYVSPADPHSVVLVREISFLPVAITCFGAIFAAVGVGAFITLSRNLSWGGAGTTDSLQPVELSTMARRRKGLIAAALLVPLPVALVCADYFAVAPRPWPWYADALGSAIGVLLVVCAWALLRTIRMGQVLEDPQISIAPAPAVLGQKVACVAEVRIKNRCTVRHAEVELRCTQTYIFRSSNEEDVNTSVAWRNTQTLAQETPCTQGDALHWAAEFVLPADQPPTGSGARPLNIAMPAGAFASAALQRFANASPLGASSSTVTHWEFHLKIAFRGRPAYRGTYRFEVVAAAAAAAPVEADHA